MRTSINYLVDRKKIWIAAKYIIGGTKLIKAVE
jgi:hypothetical protein